jgi:YqaJ-like viral recombinase domain
MEERLKRITASNSHLITKLGRKTDNTAALNKHFGRRVYKKLIPLMEYGKEHEKDAVVAYEVATGLQPGTVKPCGLIVSLANGIFAASPDGLLFDDGLLEVENRNGELKLKTSHVYYYQVVMQIYVADRQWCDFFVWTPKGYHVERIHRNEETNKLWRTMTTNMEFFWSNDLAPELVDSRFERGYTEYSYPPQ